MINFEVPCVSCTIDEDSEEEFAGGIKSVLEESIFYHGCINDRTPTFFNIKVSIEKRGYGEEQ